MVGLGPKPGPGPRPPKPPPPPPLPPQPPPSQLRPFRLRHPRGLMRAPWIGGLRQLPRRSAGPAGTRAPSGGGSRARPSPGRDRGGARGIPAGGAGHPVSPPPPKFPGGAAAALPSPAPGLEATLGRELFPRATGPPLQLDPAPPLRPTRIPNLGGAAGLRTRAFLAAAAAASTSSRPGAGSGPSRAPRLAPRAPPSGSRSAAPAHADAGRPPGALSPEGQLSADRRRRREVGPARRCPRQRQVWELH
ncbi:translation initiation factor IF-2-like [Neovison vison]|uniref:translation initiation factor IF-2-like n=1 Tax=Neovison vison TaxID=452646 RepID=UPI001CEFFCF4|nr:translation initiation factor IF-2-like [Neogale vison]